MKIVTSVNNPAQNQPTFGVNVTKPTQVIAEAKGLSSKLAEITKDVFSSHYTIDIVPPELTKKTFLGNFFKKADQKIVNEWILKANSPQYESIANEFVEFKRFPAETSLSKILDYLKPEAYNPAESKYLGDIRLDLVDANIRARVKMRKPQD